MLTYAIGDIHGHKDRLVRLLDKIDAHARGREHRIITLGDYIDRGPDSKGVLDVLMARPDIVRLRGNHEQMLLDAVYLPAIEDEMNWLTHGGHATLKSFGIEERHPRVTRKVPESYLHFLVKDLVLSFEDERRWFVHAGVHPETRSLDEANPFDILWIRETFLRHHGRFPKYVVHGHTTVPGGKPDIRHNRVNLDTHCYATGVLTAAVFDDSQDEPIDILQTARGV